MQRISQKRTVMHYQRYAVYFVPVATELAQFGAQWLGWDVNAGCAAALTQAPDFDHVALTDRPRRYGFHATLKPPFALADGVTFAQLEQRVGDIAARHTGFDITLGLGQLGRFFALLMQPAVPQMDHLAADLVVDLDDLRRPLTDADLQRRRTARLTDVQDQLLQRWGYPYVLDEFRFHMTLTGPVPKPLQDPVAHHLTTHLVPILAHPQPVTHIAIVGQDAQGRFHSLSHIPLRDRSDV